MKYVLVKTELEPVAGKYLGQILYNGSIDLEGIAEKVCENRPEIDEPEFVLAVRAIAAEIRREVVDNGMYVQVESLCGFALAISGSVPAMDSPLTDDNKWYVNITPHESIRARLAGIIPTRGRASDAMVVMDNVEDLASGDRDIVGTREFVLTGRNLSATKDGEGLSLVGPDGADVAAASVKDEDGMGQRVNAQLDSAVRAGSYLLRLKTHGYSTPEAQVESYTKKVAVRSDDTPPPPPPTPIAETEDGQVKIMTLTDGGESSPLTFGHEWSGTGSGFQNSEAGWYVELAILRPTPEGEPIDVGCLATSDTALTVTTSPESAPAAGDYPNATLDIGFAHDDAGELVAESLTIPVHLTVE